MSTTSPPLSELVAQLRALAPDARGAAITAVSGGFDARLGLAFTWCADDRVVASLTVGAHHTQIYGLVHGGVYCAMVESVGSCGAGMVALPAGRLPVGAENRTRFVRAARVGAVLTAIGTPSESGSERSVWEVRIIDQDGTLCAEGQLSARHLPADARVAGGALGLPAGAGS